ncbi:MAG: glycosyltransferase [Pseudomonadota bacterium]
MSERSAPAWEVVASRRTKRGFIHAWGTASGERPAPRAIYLQSEGPDPRRVFGTLQCRTPTDAARVEVGFSLTGDVAPHDGSALDWSIVLEWPDGRMQQAALEAGGAARRVSPWQRYLRTAARLIDGGDFRTLFSEVQRVLAPEAWSRRDPAAVLAWLRRGGSRLVFVVDHGLGGGANVYGMQRVAELARQGYAVLRLVPDPWTLGYRLLAQRGNQSRAARVGDLAQLRQLYEGLRFDQTWFNNVLSFVDTPGVMAAVREWQVRGALGETTFLVHDFFSVCPSWTLIDHAGRFCGIPAAEVCARCLPQHRAPFLGLARGATIPEWRQRWAPILQDVHEVRCFSEASRALMLRAYPLLPRERLTVVPHQTSELPLRRVGPRDGGAPVVGVVGTISAQKGSEVLRELCRYLRDSGSSMRLVVAGTVELELAPEIATVTGAYRRDELPNLLERHGVNVALLPSVWPETYSYVTDELMQMGLPLLVFDLGAPAERVRGYARGLVMPIAGPEQIEAALMQLYARHVAGARGASA